MYFVAGGSPIDKTKLLSAFLTDYLKTASILFDLNLLDGKLIPKEFIPRILSNHIKRMTSKEIFEIISLVDFIKEVENYVRIMRSHVSDTKAMVSSFPNVDFSVYGSKGGYYKDLIFEEYQTIKYIYDYILDTRKTIFNSKKLNKTNIEVINFNVVIQKLNKFIEANDFQNFQEDFGNISSKELSIFISNRLLSNISKEEIPNFTQAYPTCIFNSKLSLLSPMYYQTTYSKVNGFLSDFSNYVYSLLYYNDFLKDGNISYISDLRQLNNYAVLEKVLHLKDIKLQNFISSIVNKNFIKDIINSGNTNELIRVIDENEDLFYQDNNESLFIICMLLDTKKILTSRREEIENEIIEIIKKDINLEYRFAELEMYIRSLIDSIMDNKKINSNKDELSELFYKSFMNYFHEIIYGCFDEFIETKEEETK